MEVSLLFLALYFIFHIAVIIALVILPNQVRQSDHALPVADNLVAEAELSFGVFLEHNVGSVSKKSCNSSRLWRHVLGLSSVNLQMEGCL